MHFEVWLLVTCARYKFVNFFMSSILVRKNLTLLSQLIFGPVDELPLVVAELKRSICRKNASKVLIHF